ncbi:MAG: phosphomannomutase/phosphoglucomutase [Xanthomonadales bacterium]|nr:phosphomannomutase/phosphoglucomutase [Xanthomonadales bacterium]
MNTPKIEFNGKVDIREILESLRFRIENLNPVVLIGAGAVALVLVLVLFLTGGTSQKESDENLAQAKQVIEQVNAHVLNFRRVLEDQQVQELAVIAAGDPEKLANLQQYISGRIPDVIAVDIYTTELETLRGADLGPFGYAVLDMLFTTEAMGLAPAQIHGKGEGSYLAMAVRVGDKEAPKGYLLAKVSPEGLVSTFKAALSKPGAFMLDQSNGRFNPLILGELAVQPSSSEHIVWLRVPTTLFRIGYVNGVKVGGSLDSLRPVLFIAGLLLLALGLLLKFRPPPLELREDPSHSESPLESTEPQEDQSALVQLEDGQGTVEKGATEESHNRLQTAESTNDGLGHIELPDLGFNLEKASMHRKKILPPVELVESIFRAYDIRGIVGQTLDADVAYQVGQVVGTLTLEQEAAPVVVARDGRESGVDLSEGLINGIASTGCDVVDIGAVPTGVLYFGAYELGSATGVMVTGSHNPPDYNGIKMLIGGVTQSGEQITDIYNRIKSGSVRVGKGNVSQQDMLSRYREKIAGDIQLQRPLKVIADCGNGIGGVAAADVLRDIGAEVITLFDEVDGSFPNHHPDPSEPENLTDLIEAVRLMNADIGVAFDGDADRLGVVTSVGEIIYSDRLMMMFSTDVLSRVPGSTIIYDVKCTGHLHHVIEEAGGRAMMYKTGHSLIKNKMREVNAPFAGEMSGHFFFKERWYGFDCGIYSACRLLEILAADERDPAEVLSGLPNSISTPELKLHMQEGENHAFVAEMQEKARFSDARITTIDGVRADFVDGWGLVRASNTTPILVLRFEGDTEQSLQRIKDVFRQQMLAINNELKMPF